MPINYGNDGSGQSSDTVTDPQKLFQALPSKAKKYAYLRDVQGDVLGKWHTSPKGKDAVIKMNTGGGKTTVGLLILKSCLNEGVGPAVYVAPDHYLCSQVEQEANDLGLKFTDDPRSPDFRAGRSILIVPVHTVFNGNSKFGVGEQNIPIGSIEEAKRRIYMTATLADDFVLVTDFGANPGSITKPITPKTASDLGERMILVPQEINTDVTDDEIKTFVDHLSETENVVVIVPSVLRAGYWADAVTDGLTLTADNLEDGVKVLKESKGNLAVLVNKYDGIDLPDDACRILVIDGVPDTRRLLDRYEQGTLADSDRYLSRQVQRIEQGMGRGIRSNEDYCVVIAMGARLLATLYAQGAAKHFSPATRRQLELSRKIAAQITEKGLSALNEPINDVLTRNKGWVAAAKNALIEVAYETEVTVDAISIAQRQAYDAFRRGKYEQAAQVLQNAADTTTDAVIKGWLMEQSAEALNRIDKAGSQALLAAAGERNSRITKPLAGIAYKKISTDGMNQVNQARAWLATKYPSGGNTVIIGVDSRLQSLIFSEIGSDAFEQALMDLGLHLGFRAQRPEKDQTAKLDVLWGIGTSQYVLFPCKSNAVTNFISKEYADQASGNANWFASTYGAACTGTPVIIHPATILDQDAFPPENTRVMGKAELEKFRAACASFASAIKDDLTSATKIKGALSANGLMGDQFLQKFTIVPKKKKAK